MMKILLIIGIFINSILLASCSTSSTVRLVLLPDTQTYTRLYPDILKEQTRWIKAKSDSIAFVLQQGDLTDYNAIEQWENAQAGMNILDNFVPYAVVMGNHDLGNNSDKRDSELYNKYFPYEKYSKLKYFGGAFESDKMDNVWYSFTAGGIKWLVLCLEFGPRNKVLKWANEVVRTHPEHKVIVNTHAYMYSDDTRMGEGDKWLPQEYGVGTDTGDEAVNNGEQMWDKFIKLHANILFVFSGHVLNDGTGKLISIGEQGNKVYQILANYQWGVEGDDKGKNGFLRVVDMDIKRGVVEVKTYSPYLNKYKTDTENQFLFRDVCFE